MGVQIHPCEGEILREKMLSGWMKQQGQQFYNGIGALEKRLTKCISVVGNYVEK